MNRSNISYNEEVLVTSGRPIVPGKSNSLLCWWCCHPFEDVPIVLPRHLYYPTQAYHVYGNFCSPNCAKAFLIAEQGQLGTKRLAWFKELLASYYSIPVGTVIHAAPPRTFLTCFGGRMSIEEFRAASVNSTYRQLKPPLIPMVTQALRTTPRRPSTKRASPKQPRPAPLLDYATRLTRRRGKPTPNHRSTLIGMLRPASSTTPTFSEPEQQQQQQP